PRGRSGRGDRPPAGRLHPRPAAHPRRRPVLGPRRRDARRLRGLRAARRARRARLAHPARRQPGPPGARVRRPGDRAPGDLQERARAPRRALAAGLRRRLRGRARSRAGSPALRPDRRRPPDLRRRGAREHARGHVRAARVRRYLEPRTARSQSEADQGVARSFVGDVNTLPTVVGGGTVHWDAKTPRFWRQDFKGRSLYGPVPDANVADWPLGYDDLAPFYDEVEQRLGVQGDVARMPAATLAQAPRSGPFPMPPNPPMYGGSLLAEGARRLGYTAYPFPMAVNSTAYDGRPRCNSCGFCSGYGCPINARGGAAVSFLHHALLAGARLASRAFVYRVNTARSRPRVSGVSYLDASGRRRSV